MDFLELWDQMGVSVKLLMGVLIVMSMASVGVFFERLFTFIQATNQSKLFAPQVAKHLKTGSSRKPSTSRSPRTTGTATLARSFWPASRSTSSSRRAASTCTRTTWSTASTARFNAPRRSPLPI